MWRMKREYSRFLVPSSDEIFLDAMIVLWFAVDVFLVAWRCQISCLEFWFVVSDFGFHVSIWTMSEPLFKKIFLSKYIINISSGLYLSLSSLSFFSSTRSTFDTISNAPSPSCSFCRFYFSTHTHTHIKTYWRHDFHRTQKNKTHHPYTTYATYDKKSK